MTKPVTFSAVALRRAIAAVRSEGLEVATTTIRPDGSIVISHLAPAPETIQIAVPDAYDDIQV